MPKINLDYSSIVIDNKRYNNLSRTQITLVEKSKNGSLRAPGKTQVAEVKFLIGTRIRMTVKERKVRGPISPWLSLSTHSSWIFAMWETIAHRTSIMGSSHRQWRKRPKSSRKPNCAPHHSWIEAATTASRTLRWKTGTESVNRLQIGKCLW